MQQGTHFAHFYMLAAIMGTGLNFSIPCSDNATSPHLCDTWVHLSHSSPISPMVPHTTRETSEVYKASTPVQNPHCTHLQASLTEPSVHAKFGLDIVPHLQAISLSA